jgi:hypothetical protein
MRRSTYAKTHPRSLAKAPLDRFGEVELVRKVLAQPRQLLAGRTTPGPPSSRDAYDARGLAI